MVLHDKKTLVSKQYEYSLLQLVCQSSTSMLRIGIENINSHLQTAKDSLLIRSGKEYCFDWIVAVHHKFTSLLFYLDEFLGDVAARKQRITTKCRYHSINRLNSYQIKI